MFRADFTVPAHELDFVCRLVAAFGKPRQVAINADTFEEVPRWQRCPLIVAKFLFHGVKLTFGLGSAICWAYAGARERNAPFGSGGHGAVAILNALGVTVRTAENAGVVEWKQLPLLTTPSLERLDEVSVKFQLVGDVFERRA